MRHFPIVIIAIPLVSAVLLTMIHEWKRHLSFPLGLFSLASSFAMCLALIPKVQESEYIPYHLGSWEPPYGIEIRIDFLGLFMMLLVLSIGLLSLLYSRRYVEREIPEDRISQYYCLFLLLVASMLGFSATGDIFNMFVFLAIISVTSYALVAVSGSGAGVKAAFRYLIMSAPASLLVLLGISILYSATGTLNMADIAGKITTSEYGKAIVASYAVFLVGFAVKAALFPLHMWLPDAHSFAPSPISALLSGLVVKMGIFGILRLSYSVYKVQSLPDAMFLLKLLGWVGGAAVLYGSLEAIKQRDLKRMIAYSTVAHIGYIFVGIGLMDRTALIGSIFHILDHALEKSCFFLVAGSFIYTSRLRQIQDLKGARKKMPLSCYAFALASLSVIGIPPSAGFVSKWYLISGSFSSGNISFGILLLVGSMLAAWYCLKVVYYMFFSAPESKDWQGVRGEAPMSMTGSVWVLSAATLVSGFFAYFILPFIEKAVASLI